MRLALSLLLTLSLALAACSAAPVQKPNHGGGASEPRWRTTLGAEQADMVPKTKKVFALTRRCAQGPFEFDFDPLGGAFSEYVQITIHGGKAMTGHWEFKGGGYPSTTSSHFYSTAPDGKWVERPDNAFCTVEPTGPTPLPTGGPSGTPGGGGGGGAPPAKGPPAGGSAQLIVEVPAPKAPLPINTTIWVHFDFEKPPVGKVHLTVWSEVALDFGDDAYLVVEQGVFEPLNVPAWKAELEKKKQKKAEDHQKQEKTKLCYKDYAATKVWSDDCRKALGDLPERDARRDACWSGWLKHKTWSDECRKEFGNGPQPDGPDTYKSTPSKPPPPAPVEKPPPKPSDNAVWVSGSFTWHTDWVWSPGTWKVPKKDVDEGKTAKAPNAAPPPKTEVPPPAPAPGMVWTEGHWFFAVEGWIWIAGAWRVPPFPGATWKASVYVQLGGKYVLVPGGWSEK